MGWAGHNPPSQSVPPSLSQYIRPSPCQSAPVLPCPRRSQLLEEAVRSRRQLLAPLVQRLGERHADLQRVTRHLRGS